VEIVFIAFRLKSGRDDDLISWMNENSQGDRSYYIREAIRKGLCQQSVSFSINKIKIEPDREEVRAQELKDIENNLNKWF
jgi:hypothetical protein